MTPLSPGSRSGGRARRWLGWRRAAPGTPLLPAETRPAGDRRNLGALCRALPLSGGSAAASRELGNRGPRQSPLCARSWPRAWNVRLSACPFPTPRQLRVLAPGHISGRKSHPLATLRSGGPGSELMRPEVSSVSPRSASRCERAVFCRGICSVQNWDLGSPVGVGTRALTLSVAAGLNCLASVSLRLLFSPQAHPHCCPSLFSLSNGGCFLNAAKLGCVLFIPLIRQNKASKTNPRPPTSSAPHFTLRH